MSVATAGSAAIARLADQAVEVQSYGPISGRQQVDHRREGSA